LPYFNIPPILIYQILYHWKGVDFNRYLGKIPANARAVFVGFDKVFWQWGRQGVLIRGVQQGIKAF